ncbi:hypothetical protein SAMN04490186_5398 [Pseudomonas grimontii]|uniref:Uncharacterized protein n=1 Tax=Pseudomonas grimontii TaxID=129847 RepID=A0ABY0TXG5_9PSED|nr:hypothetical protein SAMN04490186_5398 [Pseudomonas grimontii]
MRRMLLIEKEKSSLP